LVTRKGPKQYLPVLASSWAVQPDGLTWLFRIREGVTFHNGDKLTANDIVASMRRIIDPDLGGAFGTQGVYASYIGSAFFEAPKNDVFKIITNEPMADLLDLISDMPIAPSNELDILPNEYIGTGLYSVVSKTKEEVVMEKNRKHWGKKAIANEVTWIEISDPINRLEMVKNREANIGALIDYNAVKEHSDSNRSFIYSLESSLCIIFMMNLLKGVCKDRRIRQALNYGLDVDAIIQKVKQGTATRLNGYITPHHLGYNNNTKFYQYEPNHAKELLNKAGYSNGMKITIDLPKTMPDEAPELGQIMKKYYEKIGIDVEIMSYRDRRAYAEMVRDKKIHDLCCFDSSPLSTFRVLREKIHSRINGPWWEGYRNLLVDQLIDQSQITFEIHEREAIYKKIFQIIRDDAPWVFLYRPTYFWILDIALKNWVPTSIGILNLAN
jgi:peptide/nickel transport system substrate-binding protein